MQAIYLIPGISTLDATINIGNQESAQFFGSRTISVRDLLIPDGLAVIEWASLPLTALAFVESDSLSSVVRRSRWHKLKSM